jgi:hypothetical protein
MRLRITSTELASRVRAVPSDMPLISGTLDEPPWGLPPPPTVVGGVDNQGAVAPGLVVVEGVVAAVVEGVVAAVVAGVVATVVVGVVAAVVVGVLYVVAVVFVVVGVVAVV